MSDRQAGQAGGEHSAGKRVATLAVAGLAVVIALPLAFVGFGGQIDRLLGLAPFIYPPASWLLGGALGLAGWLLALWAVYVQVDRGRGTPIPAVPTKVLLVDGPYRFCRNPMTLGTIGLYKGIAIVTGSWGATALIILFLVGLLLYILLIEEKELAARFGAAYEAYRRRTAFLVPGVW